MSNLPKRLCEHCDGSGQVPGSGTGRILRVERIHADVGLRELARTVNLSPSYLCDLENDRRPWTEGLILLYRHGLPNAQGLPSDDSLRDNRAKSLEEPVAQDRRTGGTAGPLDELADGWWRGKVDWTSILIAAARETGAIKRLSFHDLREMHRAIERVLSPDPLVVGDEKHRASRRRQLDRMRAETPLAGGGE